VASNFDFVRAGWPEIAVEARKAEGYANGDPRSSLFTRGAHSNSS